MTGVEADGHKTISLEAAKAVVCAEKDDDMCNCYGKVYYGKKYVSGKPGSGTTTSFEQLQQSNYKMKVSHGQLRCSLRSMGGDPLPGYYKRCYRLPDEAIEQAAKR